MELNDTAKAALDKVSEYLAEAYSEMLLLNGTPSLADFEDAALEAAHSAAARAYGLALERLDRELRSSLPAGTRPHDRRRRTLATRLGDVSFLATRCVDAAGVWSYPLMDALDVPWGARVSPSASSLLVSLASRMSYRRAGETLAACGGSHASAACVMGLMREAGALCAAQDAEAARDLFVDGVKPGGAEGEPELCVEADGTWFSVQGPDREQVSRCEVKAVVAYSGKEDRGSRTARVGAVHHASVTSPSQFLMEAVAAVGTRYDLSALSHVHVGCDGEEWCRAIGGAFPCASTAHLDPFHVNRAVMSCFYDPKAAWSLIDAINDGGKDAAATLLEAAAATGIARPERAAAVAAYLRNNADLIDVGGPSLGTIESDNQHLYGARMDSVPCAWSRRGASDMARVISRERSGRAVPRQTREGSEGARRRKRRADRELAALSRPGGASNVVKSEGSGWEPPRASVAGASAEARFAAGLDRGMAAAGM